jgi:hypothetical protein
MQIVSFNFDKISAERSPGFKQSSITNNIEFINIEKEKLDIIKGMELQRVSFRFTILYENKEDKEKKDAKETNEPKLTKQGEIIFQGSVLLALTKDEEKIILKTWKKRQLPPQFNVILFNLILTKCTPKSLVLGEDVQLPPHIAMPRIQFQPKPADQEQQSKEKDK